MGEQKCVVTWLKCCSVCMCVHFGLIPFYSRSWSGMAAQKTQEGSSVVFGGCFSLEGGGPEAGVCGSDSEWEDETHSNQTGSQNRAFVLFPWLA